MKAYGLLFAALAAAAPVAESEWEYAPLELGEAIPIDKRAPGQNCPANLVAPYITPASIYRVQKSLPNTAFGNVAPNVVITPGDSCAIFDMYLPPESFLKTCNLQFYFPTMDQLAAGGSYTFSGSGKFYFAGYTGRGVLPNVTYNNQIAPDPSIVSPGNKTLTPGHFYAIAGGLPCPGNIDFSSFPPKIGPPFRVGGRICSDDTTFIYKQNTASCPIGLYVSYS